tara:strand:+ start:1152 stop:1292 length:141 start_codon:yes stop_codon:yes gene_type:complete
MKVTAWNIQVIDEEGNEHTIGDMPDSVSQVIDAWLTTLEDTNEGKE